MIIKIHIYLEPSKSMYMSKLSTVGVQARVPPEAPRRRRRLLGVGASDVAERLLAGPEATERCGYGGRGGGGGGAGFLWGLEEDCLGGNIHAYMHTCIHAYMHTCIHAYMHTCIHAYMHTCIHAYMHTCIHAYMHTCIHAYTYIPIHNIYIYICYPPPPPSDLPFFRPFEAFLTKSNKEGPKVA